MTKVPEPLMIAAPWPFLAWSGLCDRWAKLDGIKLTPGTLDRVKRGEWRLSFLYKGSKV
jgi:hypothetical protein